MPSRINLTPIEIRRAFESGELAAKFPVILNVEQAIDLLNTPRSTFYQWMSEGRLDGTFRRRGKRIRFWRDRLVDSYFNAPDWN